MHSFAYYRVLMHADAYGCRNVVCTKNKPNTQTKSCNTVYHFRLLYVAGSFWPVMGALRYAGGQWEIYKRVETGGKMGEAEEYQLLEALPTQPDGGAITSVFSRSWS